MPLTRPFEVRRCRPADWNDSAADMVLPVLAHAALAGHTQCEDGYPQYS
jgi:hypothetical protein